jgi:hypothetical protein
MRRAAADPTGLCPIWSGVTGESLVRVVGKPEVIQLDNESPSHGSKALNYTPHGNGELLAVVRKLNHLSVYIYTVDRHRVAHFVKASRWV